MESWKYSSRLRVGEKWGAYPGTGGYPFRVYVFVSMRAMLQECFGVTLVDDWRLRNGGQLP
jgi:hypothetical protein